MPLLVTEAAKLSLEDKQRGVIEEIIDKDELFALIPFVKSNDKIYSYNRELTLSEGDFLSAYDPVPEGAATFDPVSTTLKVLAGDVDMDKFTTEVQSGLNDQIAIQIAAKAKALGRKFRRTIVNGNSSINPKEFDGLRTLITSSQTLVAGTDGNAITTAALDELLDAVKHGADALMMRQGTWRAVRALLRSMGGNTATHIMIKDFGQLVPAYDGIPIILNNFIDNAETQGANANTTSVYAVRLNEVDGFHGLYGGASAGIRLEDIGTIQNQDAERWRVKWYCGSALKSTQSCARLKGITNI